MVVTAVTLVPPLDQWWLTYPEAAALAGPSVTVAVVRNWASRGYVDHRGERQRLHVLRCDDGRRRVLAIEVLRAEAATRRRARRVLQPASA